MLRRSDFSTWRPRRRTHLLCLLCATFLTLVTQVGMSPLHPEWVVFEVAGGVGVALVSPWPLVGGLVSLLAFCAFQAVAPGAVVAFLPTMAPWLCASVLVTRGFNRTTAYGLVALSAAVHGTALFVTPDEQSDFAPFVMMSGIGVACLVIAELVRRPRRQIETTTRRYEADLERQRLLVVSELHDTVVRDLTQAVMKAEQARLTHPEGAPLARDLGVLTNSVRTAVEQLRSNLRAMSDAGGGAGLDVLASSAPRPLAEVLDETRAILGGRGVALEVVGVEAVGAASVSPGVRQQLVRVLGEMATNMSKYAAGPGAARLVVESDGRTLEAMASNGIRGRAPEDPARTAARAAVSSGLGLEGARRRVEALGGTFDVVGGADRFTVVLSVPL